MKLLNETEERRRRQHLDKFFKVLRKIDIFESLDDDALSDLTLLLDVKTIPLDKIIIKKGEAGSNLYIILSGVVAIMADDGSRLAEMGPGEIFGEMSLLSGEPVNNSVHTLEVTQVAMLSVKNFKHVLKKYPVLQLFLFKLLVNRAQARTLRSGIITSGMSGELAEISAVDLFQLINSSQKTGTIDLSLDQGRAMVFFRDGEIVYARFLKLRNKDAVFALLEMKEGHFAYSKGIPAELDSQPPIGGFMGLMMEGLQRIDENKE
jgi:CRP/FNR family transcriptional regulator, cyclic AMP receptor protein